MPQYLDSRTQRPRSSIATDEGDIVRAGESGKASGEFLEPVFVNVGKGQCQQRPGRLRAHRRQIAQIYRKNTMANGSRGTAVRKMDAVDQGIDRCNQVAARRRIQ